jgi:hypothetical protein
VDSLLRGSHNCRRRDQQESPNDHPVMCAAEPLLLGGGQSSASKPLVISIKATKLSTCRVPSEWSVPFDDARIEEKELAAAEPCDDAVMGL